MTQELTLSDPGTLIVNEAESLTMFQAPLKEWAVKKLEESQAEWKDLDEAIAHGKKNKWNTRALSSAKLKAFARITFYEKVVAALSAGYMLFPPVPNADVIAVRTEMEPADKIWKTPDNSWSRPALQEHVTEAPPIGEGEYKHPFTGWLLLSKFKNEKQQDMAEWGMRTTLKDPEFPLVMAKPTIVQATNAAMEGKFFDEIRLFPFTKRRGDPCILGSIFNPREDRRLYFLISWRIDREDL